MKSKRGKISFTILMILCIIIMSIDSYAHSGRTDSNGGHKDKNNVSGLGSYHYHCGGHPAHLHTGGVCPYSGGASSSSTSTPKSSNTKQTTTSTVKTKEQEPIVIKADEIKIDKNSADMKVGDTKTLIATITPENTENKTVTWKSSNEDLAIVSLAGIVTCKKEGKVTITAETTNGKTDSIDITIKEEEKANTVNVVKTSSTNTNQQKSENKSQKNSNPLGGILTLAIIGGGSFFVYRKIRGKK